MDDLLIERLAFYLFKKMNRALYRYHMIEDGDRIAVAVSGGKDSLSLLKLLLLDRKRIPVSYDLVAIHVESDVQSPGDGHRHYLESVFRKEGVAYSFERMEIGPTEGDGKEETDCFWCSWNRRKKLFAAAQKMNCGKIAFGHHADDVAETTLLNLFAHGRLETMEPTVTFFHGALTLIRPLFFIPEKELVRFAGACGFPSRTCICPAGETSKRARMKDFLRMAQKDFPKAKQNLFRAVEHQMDCADPAEAPAEKIEHRIRKILPG